MDALIVEQEKLIALLAEKRQATISHAVTKGLNPDAPMKDSGVAWLSTLALGSEKIREGLKDTLLGPAQLYEALRARSLPGGFAAQ